MQIPYISEKSWTVITKTEYLDQLYTFTYLEEKYLVYTLNNRFFVTKDSCPHRKYPLSEGEITEKGLVCPYHGWCFSEAETIIPGKQDSSPIKLKNYPTKIVNGYLWFYPALFEEPPELNFPLLENKHSSLSMETTVNAPAYLIIENTLDPFHTPFVHAGLVRGHGSRKTVDIDIKSTPNSVEAIYLNEGTQSGFISKFFGGPNDIGIGRYVHPGIVQLEYKDDKVTKILMQAYLRPITKEKTIAYIELEYIKHPLRFFKTIFGWLISLVLGQDKRVVETQFSNMKENDAFVNTELDFLAPYINKIIQGNGIESEKRIQINI